MLEPEASGEFVKTVNKPTTQLHHAPAFGLEPFVEVVKPQSVFSCVLNDRIRSVTNRRRCSPTRIEPHTQVA
jgi:hypothetical protein